ncbi:MAG: hypothetical protein KAZ14_00790 [Nitrosomonas sp.]|nr:hypothetical protein [Nitrosomonas sp.]
MTAITQPKHFGEKALLELLLDIGKSAARLTNPDQAVTGFISMQGCLYNNELMVVGRATNGWIDKEKCPTPNELTKLDTAKDHASTVINELQGDDPCPMKWVADKWGRQSGSTKSYNTKKSAFWRVSHCVLIKLGIVKSDDMSWPSHLVWSNLYKLAPANGGNPGKKLCDIQLDECVRLLQLELSTYRPKRLLLLTGLDWAEPFIRDLEKPSISSQNFKYVEAYAPKYFSNGGTTKIVVAAHPQGKDESTWVQEVIKAFLNCDCQSEFKKMNLEEAT